MNLKRLGLYYIFFYLIIGGLGFLFFPTISSHLLFSNVVYDDIPLRFAGMICIMFGFLIYQIIHQNIKNLYGATVVGRVFVLLILIWFYTMSHNPIFLIVFGIVLVGLIITCLGFLQK